MNFNFFSRFRATSTVCKTQPVFLETLNGGLEHLRFNGVQNSVLRDRITSNTPDTSHKHPWRFAISVWRYQFLAFLLSAASLTTLIAVAAAFSGCPLSSWPWQFISINGTAAALTVLFKGAIMVLVTDSISQAKWAWFLPRNKRGRALKDLELIDDASRGPWGSLVWLLKRPLHPHFINYGAFLTILISAVDIFSQQLINIEDRTVNDTTQKAHVPWAINNSAPITSETWLAAFNSGIYTSVVADLPVDCPSANCTWDGLIPSVGVCGECIDITNKMPQTWMSCLGFFCNYTVTGSYPSPTIINGLRPNASLGDYRGSDLFPGPPSGKQRYDVPISVIFNFANSGSLTNAWPIFGNNDEWYENKRILLGTFGVIDFPLNGATNAVGDPVVTKCSFWPCMQAFNISVAFGRSEQMTLFEGNLSYASIATKDILMSNNQQPKRTFLREATFSDVSGFNMQQHKFSVGPLPFYGTGGSYSLASINEITTSNPARQLTIEYSHENDDEPRVSLSDPVFFQRWRYTMDDRSGWANRIAKSLTNAICLQNQPRHRDDVYAGNVWIHEVIIQIYWPWVAYPISVFILSLALFASNTARCLKTGEKPWGNGTVALLMSDVNHAVKVRARGSYNSARELSKSVGEQEVYLREDELGWAFHSV